MSYEPNYSDSYGAPQAPPVNYDPNGGYNGGYYPSQPYPAFFSDIELTMRLGQAALIAFIILVVVLVAFILLMCCVQCPSLFGGRQAYYAQDPNNLGYNYSQTSEFKT